MTANCLIVMAVLPIGVGLVALVAGVVCRAAGPGVRNLVWNAALICCLIAPVASVFAPRMSLRIRSDLIPAGLSSIGIPLNGRKGSGDVLAKNSAPSSRLAADQTQAIPNPESLLLILWLAGALFFAIRFGRQVESARGVTERATPMSEGAIPPIVDYARSALGYSGRLRVLKSRDIDIPVAAGILSPTILLPEAAADWNDADLKIVVLHELAHLKRGDVFARALSMAACAIHWFNPLIWLLGNLAARDAELAADDVVLNVGIRPSRYAETLLSVVDWITRYPIAEPAMSFASRSRLPHRIHSILRDGARREVKATTRWVVCSAACGLAALAACVRLTPTAVAAPVTTAHTSDVGATWIADATRQLIVTLDDPSPQVRGEAAHALGRLGAKGATDRLEKLLTDPDKFVRYEAQQALEILARANGSGE